MKEVQEHTSTVNDLDLHIIETNQYKTNTVVLMLKAPLKKETVTMRSLLPHVLQTATEQLSTRQEIRNHLDALYGATLSGDVSKKGESHVIAFRMDVTNEKFLQDSASLTEQALKLLADVLLSPKLEGEGFSSQIVENEKRSLKQRIQSVNDDKMRYANMRVTQEMCKGEPYGLFVNGDENDVDTITPKQLYDYYQNALIEDQIDLYLVGEVESNEIKSIVEKIFTLPDGRQPVSERSTGPVKAAGSDKEERVVLEEQDVNQGKLNIGYRTYTTFGDDDYYALQVFNGLFGGFSHSKLFINVREKASLAYYAASRFESHKGLLMVMSGIEFANYEKAVTIIKEQMENMRTGHFTDGEISQTKAMIKNQLLESIDVPKGLVELRYHNVVAGHERSMSEWLQGIDNVTKDEVIAVAKKVKLDTIYFLKGKEEA